MNKLKIVLRLDCSSRQTACRDLLIILGERYLFVCCSFCFVKRGNNHYSVHVINTSWKPSNENSETRCDKTEYILHSYFHVAVLLCSRWETACVKPKAILRRERNGHNSPRTTRIYQSNTFYFGRLVSWLFLGDGGLIEIVSESRGQFTSVDSSIVKGPIRLRDSRGQNLAADTNSCERLYQALF